MRLGSELLLIRVDGSSSSGTGHVMRCLALAQAWRKAGTVIFAVAQCTPALEERVREEGFEVRKLLLEPGSRADAQETTSLALQAGVIWVVVDGYQFGADYQRAIKSAGLRLLFFDDYGHAGYYCADLVINQNWGAEARTYTRREPHTRLLLGTRYALLRSEFLTWQDWRRETPTVARRVLVTLGGSDPHNITGKVVEALKMVENFEAVVVVGGSNPHWSSLKADRRKLATAFELVVNAKNMPELMARADIAITAAGATLWEMAFMGLPSLVVLLADNQRINAEFAKRTGLGIYLGWHTDVNPQRVAGALTTFALDRQRREDISGELRKMVDGQGAMRVVDEMLDGIAPVP
jgi:UDP-2,4-diacetamido-2,4,6-trideoxy-beta-L-altropyranose hydrolase